jgi:hypothetical protein
VDIKRKNAKNPAVILYFDKGLYFVQ